MRTEKEKMLGGEAYNASDPQLVSEREHARTLCQEFTALPATAPGEQRRTLLSSLFGVETDVYITAPVFLRLRVQCETGYERVLQLQLCGARCRNCLDRQQHDSRSRGSDLHGDASDECGGEAAGTGVRQGRFHRRRRKDRRRRDYLPGSHDWGRHYYRRRQRGHTEYPGECVRGGKPVPCYPRVSLRQSPERPTAFIDFIGRAIPR